MITRKAAVGFILLAIIVFAISSYDTSHAVDPSAIPTQSLHQPLVTETLNPSLHLDTDGISHAVYRPPLFDFGKDTPIIITICIETFTLVCYLIAKRVEPRIIAWEQSERERLRREEMED